MSRYQWNPSAGVSGRYRDTRTGRFVAGRVVRSELDAYLAASDDVVAALAGQLRDRAISLADWELAMRAEIKRTHLNAIAMQRGGWANMTPADYGRAGQIIREQYGFLKNFAADILSGKQRLDGTLARRMKLYVDAGRNSFYKSLHANRKPQITHVMSIRTARDSCKDCIELDRKWFRIGDPRYLLPGRRQCNHNCQCHETMGYFDAEGVAVEVETI
jgi:hypothetical protein